MPSSSAISVAVVIPPAAVRRAAPPPGRRAHGGRHGLEIESAHGAFFFHLREQKPADHRRELADPLEHRRARSGAPTLHDHLAALGVHCGDHSLAR